MFVAKEKSVGATDVGFDIGRSFANLLRKATNQTRANLEEKFATADNHSDTQKRRQVACVRVSVNPLNSNGS